MNEEHPHPLLAQVPLTVSPFLSLPQATPLPHTYKPLPSILPPSVTDIPAPPVSSAESHSTPQQKPEYVISHSTGHSAHPDQIIESCRALQEHLKKIQEDTLRALSSWEGNIRDRELAEKRRVAPGWLDVEESGRGLVPERIGSPQSQMEGVISAGQNETHQPNIMDDGGAAIDRAFGTLSLQ